MGVKPVQCVKDISEEYIEFAENTVENKTVFQKTLEKGEKIVYSCISLEPIHLDTLYRKVSMNIDDIQLMRIKLALIGVFNNCRVSII
ncbi:MAG: hypothetical protein CVV02_13900 [Firmicutes bacterium HGW-Firmicutes-7]|nr:MAG: hypothetical protein CVV02_13900 [Firmicutes bacterium HGW-Firmicutes-7]